jgi:hypothetical protein
MKRRRFLFWIGLGIFSLGEKLRANAFDDLAATVTGGGKSAATHWRALNNNTWRWYERETLIDGRWKVTGITTPIHRETGEPFTGAKGYLDQDLVPKEMRIWDEDDDIAPSTEEQGPLSEHLPSETRRARHGRPPSKWLRGLHADELRIWLKTIDVPEALVEGMSFWTHLTRDHYFDANNITGLTESEQAKLHAAAHHGY